MSITLMAVAMMAWQAGPQGSQAFRSPGGDFSITMPGPTKEEKSTDPGLPPATTWTAEDAGRVYSVRSTPITLPAEKAAVLDLFNKVEAVLVADVKGKVIEKRDLTYEGRPAREVIFEGEVHLPQGNYGVASVRLFYAGGQAYRVVMAVPGDALAPSTRKEVETFFAGFHLTAPPEKLAEGKPGAAGPKGAAKADWREYAPEKARFTVQLPGAPIEQESEPEMEGKKARLFASAVVVEGATFAVVQLTLPERVPVGSRDEFLDLSARGVIDEVQGRLSNSKAVPHANLVGLELDYEGKLADGSPGVFRSRLFVTGDRYYNLMVSAPPGKAPNKEARRFFDSFRPEKPRTTPKAAPKPGRRR